jgi:hypothetical protein
VFEGLAKEVQNISPELGEFIEKEDSVVREAHLPGMRDVPASDETRVVYGVVG